MAIDILFFEDLSSTSAHAADELRQGREPPFAVCAARQSGGRGRRGRAWNSPVGGLYITVVLPPPSLDIGLFGHIPLWVGAHVSTWIKERLGCQIALKWPNDLMFDGRKLGGILVESGMEGTKAGPVLIGIGINANETPTVDATEKDHVLAVSLAEVTGGHHDIKALATELAQGLQMHWAAADIAAASKDFLARSAPATRMWQSGGAYFYAESVESDGALILKALADPAQMQKLNSADHKFTACSRAHPMPVALADVGNTATKIRLYRSFWSDDVLAETRVLHEENSLPAELARLASLLPSRGWPLMIASVAPVRSATLFALAEAAGFSPVALQKKSVLRRGDFYPLQELGIDRLAAIEGWLSRRPAAAAVIASCGTALTVDAVQKDGTHVGGVIAPGLALAARSLHEHTGLLPLIDQGDFNAAGLSGSSTRSAIASGIKGQSLGLIARILHSHPEEQARVVLCGGDAALVAPGLPEAEVDEDLIFTGLRAIAGGGLLRTKS